MCDSTMTPTKLVLEGQTDDEPEVRTLAPSLHSSLFLLFVQATQICFDLLKQFTAKSVHRYVHLSLSLLSLPTTMKLSTILYFAAGVVSFGISGLCGKAFRYNRSIHEAADFYERRFAAHENMLNKLFHQWDTELDGCQWQARLQKHHAAFESHKFDLKGFAESDSSPECIEEQPYYILWANGVYARLRRAYVQRLSFMAKWNNPTLVMNAFYPTSMNALFPSDRDVKHHPQTVQKAFLSFHKRKGTVWDHMEFSHPSIVSQWLTDSYAWSYGKQDLHASLRRYRFSATMMETITGVLAVVFCCVGIVLCGAPLLTALVSVGGNIATSRFVGHYFPPGLGLCIYLSTLAYLTRVGDTLDDNYKDVLLKLVGIFSVFVYWPFFVWQCRAWYNSSRHQMS